MHQVTSSRHLTRTKSGAFRSSVEYYVRFAFFNISAGAWKTVFPRCFECFRCPVETIGAMVRYWELVTRNLFRLLFFNEYMRIPYVRICQIFQNRQIDQQACRLLAKSFPSKATTVFVRYSIAIVKN